MIFNNLFAVSSRGHHVTDEPLVKIDPVTVKSCRRWADKLIFKLENALEVASTSSLLTYRFQLRSAFQPPKRNCIFQFYQKKGHLPHVTFRWTTMPNVYHRSSFEHIHRHTDTHTHSRPNALHDYKVVGKITHTCQVCDQSRTCRVNTAAIY